jgi:hypothetical protein
MSHVDELFCLNIRETTLFAMADAYKEWHDRDEQEVLAIIKELYTKRSNSISHFKHI